MEMRTTDRTLHLGHARPSLPLRARLTLAFDKMASVLRALRNRREINHLNGLSDSELLDIGLTRHDVESALNTSSFFADPSSYLTDSARHRTRFFGLSNFHR